MKFIGVGLLVFNGIFVYATAFFYLHSLLMEEVSFLHGFAILNAEALLILIPAYFIWKANSK